MSKIRRHGLDIFLILIALASAAAIVFFHEKPFGREWLCQTIRCVPLPNGDAWFKIGYDLGIGGLTSLMFYVLLVRLPDAQKRGRVKRSLSGHYLAFRKDLIPYLAQPKAPTIMIWSSACSTRRFFATTSRRKSVHQKKGGTGF